MNNRETEWITTLCHKERVHIHPKIKAKHSTVRAICQVNGKQYKELKHPMVYIWKRDDTYLYIGCSTNGMIRIFDREHHVIRKHLVISTDKITMMFFNSREKMCQMELHLIRKHKPIYNKKY